MRNKHMHSELFYQVALTRVPRIGPVHAKILVEHFGSASAIFQASRKSLSRIEGIGEIRAQHLKNFSAQAEVEAELRFIEKEEVEVYFLTDRGYPQRLLHCYDPPTLLYGRGHFNVNPVRTVAIIGTRMLTAYGRQQTEKLVAGLQPYGVLVVSGLALGIDAVAHRAAVEQGLPTVGIMANGINKLYPPEHRQLVQKMLAAGGGILTELPGNTQADKHFFPARNRIVAGMADVVVVMETGRKGGSMITAELANGYNREVAVFPGRATDVRSEGCIQLVQQNKAQLITGAEELVQLMQWKDVEKPACPQQQSLFTELGADETAILKMLQTAGPMHIDHIAHSAGLPGSTIAGLLLQLELGGFIRALPGKMYAA